MNQVDAYSQVPQPEEEAKKAPAAPSFMSTAVAAAAEEGRLTWRGLRAVGAGFWLSDPQLLRCGLCAVLYGS